MKDSGFDPARDITTRPCFPTIFSICWQEGYSKRLHQQTLGKIKISYNLWQPLQISSPFSSQEIE